MIFLSQSDVSGFYVILLFWAGVLMFFPIASLVIKLKGDRIKKKLHAEGGYVFFPDVEIQRTAKIFLGPNFSWSSKCEVAIGQEEIWFLPRKYSLMLFFTPVPNRVNLSSEKVSFNPEFHRSVLIRFTAEDLYSSWELGSGFKIKYEVSLTFKDSEIREEVIRELEKQKSGREI